MTSKERAGLRIIGTLRSADGKGVVTMQDRFDTPVDDLWSALTDPGRLARWLGQIEGDLRLGGEFTARFADGYEGTGRVEVCEPPHRVLVAMDEGKADAGTIEVILTGDGHHTTLVWEERGMPLKALPCYGAGIQLHVEQLASYLAGRELCDIEARSDELLPAYLELAASVG